MLPNSPRGHGMPAPPGVVASIRAGFDAIATHIGLILMPLALDLLLWLGPRLSVKGLMQPVLEEMARLGPTAGLATADMNSMLEMYRELLARLNLLVALRTFPIGVSSLMSGRMPAVSPIGLPFVLEIGDVGQLFAVFFLLTLIGWMLGGLYFNWVAALVTSGLPEDAAPTAARAISQTILFSLIWMMLLWTLGVPALFVLYIAFAINALLGQGVLLFMGFALIWILVPLFFSPHGIYVRHQNAFASFLGGFRLTRLTLPGSSFFVLAVLLVGMGLNLLWAVPAENSWLALIGILGHAFITTALLASSFIYYQEMSAWLQAVLARLQSSPPAQAA